MQGFSPAHAAAETRTTITTKRCMSVTKPEMLYLRQLTLGPMKNFIYLIGAKDSKVATVVDPSWDAPAIERQLAQDGRTLGAIWLSHHHYDHIGSVSELLHRHDVPVYVQAKEHDFSE